MKLVKVAAATLNQTPLDWERNKKNILDAISEARSDGVGILCLPELCITGYGCEDMFLSPAVLGAVPCHPALWHCVRDLAHSIATFRGVWDQTVPGFLSRVIRDHGHFRDVVPFHWALFEPSEADAREHGGAYLFNASLQPVEAVA